MRFLSILALLLMVSCSSKKNTPVPQRQPVGCTVDSECTKSNVNKCTITNSNGVCTCGSNAACSGDTAYCNAGTCQACSDQTHCNTQETDTCVAGKCVCGTEEPCTTGQFCSSGKCVNCVASSQCMGASDTCNASGNCVCGTSNSICSGSTPYCVKGACKACASNTECTAQNAKTCNTQTGVCGCGTNGACSGLSDTCSASNQCVCGSKAGAVACSGTLVDQCSNGACVCGSTGKACNSNQKCSGGQCSYRRVFVTSRIFQPGAQYNFSSSGTLRFGGSATTGTTGADDADRACGDLAQRAGLSGKWMAWLATNQRAASDRVGDNINSGDVADVYLVDGTTKISGPVGQGDGQFNSRVSNHVNPINMAEDKSTLSASQTVAFNGSSQVWIGVNSTSNCTDYSKSDTSSIQVGNVQNKDSGWNNEGNSQCNAAQHLYCIEVDK